MKWTVNQIKLKLNDVKDANDPFINECKLDHRKGVQLALKQWYKRIDKLKKEKEKYIIMNKYENILLQNNYSLIAGIDEVGRGPLAGPVVAAAVILDKENQILGLDDSKKLSNKNKIYLYNEIKDKALSIGIGVVDSQEIDKINIYEATKKAMLEAILKLDLKPDFLLIDAMELKTNIPQKKLIKGDLNSNSIAAASIIAKVTRDELMKKYSVDYPGYGFESNAGYGTKEHLKAIDTLGATPIHRKSFSPIKNIK